MSMIGKSIKIKYIGEKSHGDFSYNVWYDAFLSKDKRMVLVLDKNGDGFAYPVSLFEIKEE